jgi:hypothetical protein
MATLTRTEMMLAGYRCYASREDVRPCDAEETMRQIGMGTTLAVSGGRWLRVYNTQGAEKTEVGVLLPCGSARAVEVVLNAFDVYEVRRVRLITRGEDRGNVVVEALLPNVFCDELRDAVYQLSCWR